MKILSGIDIVSNLKIKKLLQRSPDSLGDIFSETEIEYCRGKRYPEQSFGARFAAKEAILKAVDAHILTFALHEIEIATSASGKPEVRIHNAALISEIKRLLSADAITINVSLSHEEDFSIAQVIIYPS